MKPRFRLTSSTDFKRVRRFGKSYAHPLLVLVVHPNDLALTRFGVTAGRSLGGAVNRNRAKRRIRAALLPFLEEISPGWDIILIARQPLQVAPFQELQFAVKKLIGRAELLQDSDEHSQTPTPNTSGLPTAS